MKKVVAVVAVVFWAAWSLAPSLATDDTWLVGKWELSYDPDGNEKDWLEFTKNGEVFSISSKGRRVPGQYAVTESDIHVTYTFNGKAIPITLKFSPDKRKLLAYSKRTGNASEYRKTQ